MYRICFIISICLSVLLAGCDTWSDDFNDNKNIPKVLSNDPSSFMGAVLNGPFRDNSEWVALQSVQPVVGTIGRTRSLSQGGRHRAWHDFDGRVWPVCYPTLPNVKNVRNAAIASGQSQYIAVADIWESWIMFTLTTFYGDLPYFAAVEDTLVFTVDYDRQAEIYPAILEKLRNASEMIGANPVDIDANSDYLYAGDIRKWRKFANTLRVRMCMHMYNAAPEQAKSILNEMLADPQRFPVFESNDDNCAMHYDGSSEDRSSEFYRSSSTWSENCLVSNVLIERLISLKDPRLPLYAYPVKQVHTEDNYIRPSNPGPVKYLGHIYGLTVSDADATAWNGGLEYGSAVGPWFRHLDADGNRTEETKKTPLFLVTYPELSFLLAEAAQRGIIAGDAKAYYETGVKAAFEQYGATFSGEGYAGAYADLGLSSEIEYLQQPQVNWDGGRDKLTLIAEQKWIALFNVPFENYFDHRRTMLPLLSCSNLAATYNDGSGTRFPARADYPASEEQSNADGWAKARATGFDIPITGDNNRTLAKMWLINNPASPDLQMPVFREPLRAQGEYPGDDNFNAWYQAHWKELYWWEYE
ncbi:MAG: SusD/RagB family nutrient-binding outer membrane lipoprotein [Tannerella sp.]|jgi:hypothetical protein|nr:SusD/RagB family nutrient-binding outer membrane lipoprotein [Tannerella sp.]